MPTTTIEIPTADGPMHTQIVTPAGAGPWPAVVFAFDAGGLRPAMTEMAERIAADGYVVAVPDLFHRAGSILECIPEGTPKTFANVFGLFKDEKARAKFFTHWYTPATDYNNLETDVGAVLDNLQQRGHSTGKVGTTGYCMGGNISVRIATVFGDRIAATAAFHPGGLVTAAADSPHLRVATIKSRVYLAPAIGDLTEEAQAQLDAALTAAGVDHTIEVYPAQHGYAVPDHSTYDAAQSERHFGALRTLFAATLA